jgi:hypothetical protein
MARRQRNAQTTTSLYTGQSVNGWYLNNYQSVAQRTTKIIH